MSERRVTITIKADTARAVAALRSAAKAISRMTMSWLISNTYLHHRQEDPTRSAMHAAYDRRRRARRRKGRR